MVQICVQEKIRRKTIKKCYIQTILLSRKNNPNMEWNFNKKMHLLLIIKCIEKKIYQDLPEIYTDYYDLLRDKVSKIIVKIKD
jgi:hypothetical protein